MVAALAPHRERPGMGVEAVVPEGEVARQVVIEGMAAPLRLERQHECRIGVDVDAVDRVHLDGDGEAHMLLPPGRRPATRACPAGWSGQRGGCKHPERWQAAAVPPCEQ